MSTYNVYIRDTVTKYVEIVKIKAETMGKAAVAAMERFDDMYIVERVEIA